MANRPEGVMNRVPFGQVKNRPLIASPSPADLRHAYITLIIGMATPSKADLRQIPITRRAG